MLINKPEWYLVSTKDRAPNNEGLIGEEALLNNPLIDELCDKIIADFVPKHRFAIFSLCTSTRPYIKSPKWKKFFDNFGTECDLIICSNGGIIPIEYQYCYPFMTYDAHGDHKTDELYKQKFKERLDKFLKVHGDSYEKIIFSFLPSSRNREVVKDLASDRVYVLPSIEVYDDIRKNGSPGVNILRFPQCAHQHLNEISQVLNISRKSDKRRLF